MFAFAKWTLAMATQIRQLCNTLLEVHDLHTAIAEGLKGMSLRPVALQYFQVLIWKYC